MPVEVSRPCARAGLALVLAAGTALLAACGTAPPAAQSSASAVPPQYPMRDFFRNIDRGYFRLSSDGRQLGFMQPALGDDGKTRRMNIFVQALDGSRLQRRVTVPAQAVTSLCFGGGDLRDLYIVSADNIEPARKGSIFHARSDVPGLPAPFARI